VGGLKNDRHEGVDVAPAVSAVSRVLAVYDGTVTAVKSSAGYGNYVIVESIFNGRAFHTWRAHMASVSVAVGQKVKAGDVLGVCGSTGNSTGRHDHLTMTSPYGGLGGYIVANVVDPTPFYPAPGAPSQPPAATVDVLPYFRGTHRLQFDMGHNVNGGGTQTTQIWHLDANNWLYIKGENGEYERLGLRAWNGQEWIFRFEDTSESPTRFYAPYMSETGAIGAPWCPRMMQLGKVYEISKFVRHYLKAGCVPQNSGPVVDKIVLINGPRAVTYPQSGHTLPNVITVGWPGAELFDMASGCGNVAWRNEAEGKSFWFMGWLSGRPDKVAKKPGCISLGW
jgi:hypothetical protein